jgi:hypothetical protein
MFSFLTSYCQNKKNENELSKKLDIGIYVDNVYNIDYINSTYEIIFYLWSNSNGEIYEIDTKTIDIDKATEVELFYKEIDSLNTKNGKKFKYLAKFKAKMLNKMDISKYPFDNLILNLDVELLGHYKGEKNIYIDKSLK